MRYYIIAGEASGDLHGSNLMKGLFCEDPTAQIRFWGGSLMNEVSTANGQGPDALVRDYAQTAVMGITEVLLKARSIARNIKSCKEDILEWKPDVIILIDYPGFNFKIARFAHENGFKVFWYIAPKVWASREGRIRKIKKYVDKLFIVFPFEKEYFSSKGIDYIYCGNPLVDAIDNKKPGAAPAEAEGHPYLALLAGSRGHEIKSTMPVFLKLAKDLQQTPGYQDYKFLVAGAPSKKLEDYARWTGEDSPLQVVFGKTHQIIAGARAAVINSGTASLEAALIGTPQVVVYRLSRISAAIGRIIIKVKYISLGNLICDRLIFKELLQKDFTPAKVKEEVLLLTSDKQYIARMKEGYAQIRELLGGGGASAAVARAIIDSAK